MIPVNKLLAGRPNGTKTNLVGIGKVGLSISKTVYEKLGKPGYLEMFLSGTDVVCIPREVDGPNHCKRYVITNSDRAYYYASLLSKYCHKGKYLFSIDKSNNLTVKNCVKVIEENESDKEPSRVGRRAKSLFARVRQLSKRTKRP